jgi:hypothetical protein
MEAQKLLDAAPFEPSAVDPASVENARMSMAHAIIAHAGRLGANDVEALKAAALASIQKQLLGRVA